MLPSPQCPFCIEMAIFSMALTPYHLGLLLAVKLVSSFFSSSIITLHNIEAKLPLLSFIHYCFRSHTFTALFLPFHFHILCFPRKCCYIPCYFLHVIPIGRYTTGRNKMERATRSFLYKK